MKTVTSPRGNLRFTAILERSTNKLWLCHLRVPSRVVTWIRNSDARRVVCSLNGTVEYQTAVLPVGGGVFVIRVAKKILTALELSIGDRVDVKLWKDTTEYGLPLPVEFGELLRQDPIADKLFHALTRGRQRTLLHIAGAVKSSAKRAERAIAIVNHLKVNKGKIDYKRLRLGQVNRLLQ